MLKNRVAGHPCRSEVTWTGLTKRDIQQRMKKAGAHVSVNIVTRLLREHHLRRRKFSKTLPMGHTPRRNDQFLRIDELLRLYRENQWPILSMDTKKKENLGPYFRPGVLFADAPVPVFDHDFMQKKLGVLIPHGLYDIQRKVGHLYLGLSHDTSEFACDNLYAWWMAFGRWKYWKKDHLLLLCDCGGSNGVRQYLFKQDLQRLADRIQVEIRVAHYPPYLSKYNLIEHQLFPHVARAMAGQSLLNVDCAVDLLRGTHTSTGLRVTVSVNRKYYAPHREYSAEFRAAMPIRFDADLSDWNYCAVPGSGLIL